MPLCLATVRTFLQLMWMGLRGQDVLIDGFLGCLIRPPPSSLTYALMGRILFINRQYTSKLSPTAPNGHSGAGALKS